VDQDVATLDHIVPQIAAVDAELRRLSTSDVWAEQVPYLLQLPGIALFPTMTILGGLGDVTRGGIKRGLATIEEVLALRPELRGAPQTEQNGS
jgi:hypothetical protein